MAETDENASTGEQAGREQLGSTSGDELAALSHAHRKRGPTEGQKTGSEVQSERDTKGVSFQEPKVRDSLYWRKQKSQNLLPILAAVSGLNKFDNDGSFMHKFLQMQNEETNKLMVDEDKTRKIDGGDLKGTHQQKHCVFCLENAKWTNHLIVSIANFMYLMLPHSKPVVPGHCCILPLQHELATRTVHNYVWEEICNFKKCLIMMFAKQGRDVVFLETVMGLAQQHRHCLIQAPLYFKKEIDEAEDEWSQHNAKKLIDTTEKGLQASIP